MQRGRQRLGLSATAVFFRFRFRFSRKPDAVVQPLCLPSPVLWHTTAAVKPPLRSLDLGGRFGKMSKELKNGNFRSSVSRRIQEKHYLP